MSHRISWFHGMALHAFIALAFLCLIGAPRVMAADGGPPATKPAAAPTTQPAKPPFPMAMPGEILTIAGQPAFLILPKNVTPGQPIPWVWYAPCLAAGGEMKWMFQQFVDKGIAVAGCVGGDSYADHNSHATYDAFYAELVEKRGLSPRFAFLPRSRGGYLAYTWTSEHPETVLCIGGIYPVCDIPVKQVEPIAKARVPIFHLHGAIDERVPIKVNSEKLAQQYKDLGGEMKLTIIPDQGHNTWIGWFQNQELTDFLIAHATGKAEGKAAEKTPVKPEEPAASHVW